MTPLRLTQGAVAPVRLPRAAGLLLRKSILSESDVLLAAEQATGRVRCVPGRYPHPIRRPPAIPQKPVALRTTSRAFSQHLAIDQLHPRSTDMLSATGQLLSDRSLFVVLFPASFYAAVLSSLIVETSQLVETGALLPVLAARGWVCRVWSAKSR